MKYQGNDDMIHSCVCVSKVPAGKVMAAGTKERKSSEDLLKRRKISERLARFRMRKRDCRE